MKTNNLFYKIIHSFVSISLYTSIKNFKPYFALTALFISVASLSLAQFQINIGGSGYGYALNKEELVFDGFEFGTEYQTSQYLSLGTGFMLNERNYFGIEASVQQSILDGYSLNPGSFTEVMTPYNERYTANIYSYRFGLRYSRVFLPSEKFRPILSFSVQSLKESKWVEKGEYRVNNMIDNKLISKIEQYRAEYLLYDYSLYFDFRIGAAYHFNEHFSFSVALEFSSGTTAIWKGYNSYGAKKYEIALPLTIHYQFKSKSVD